MSAIFGNPYSQGSLQFILGGQQAPQTNSGVDPVFSQYGAPSADPLTSLTSLVGSSAYTGSLLQSTASLIASIKNDIPLIMANPANLKSPKSQFSGLGQTGGSSNSMMDMLKVLWDLMKSNKTEKASSTSAKTETTGATEDVSKK